MTCCWPWSSLLFRQSSIVHWLWMWVQFLIVVYGARREGKLSPRMMRSCLVIDRIEINYSSISLASLNFVTIRWRLLGNQSSLFKIISGYWCLFRRGVQKYHKCSIFIRLLPASLFLFLFYLIFTQFEVLLLLKQLLHLRKASDLWFFALNGGALNTCVTLCEI